MKLYIAYDQDGVVTDMDTNPQLLADRLGIKRSTLFQKISKDSKFYKRIEIEDGEKDECL